MIIREIIQDPIKYINNFDWFNDYQDTRNWLEMNLDYPLAGYDYRLILFALDTAYKNYRTTESNNEHKIILDISDVYESYNSVPDNKKSEARNVITGVLYTYLDDHMGVLVEDFQTLKGGINANQ